MHAYLTYARISFPSSCLPRSLSYCHACLLLSLSHCLSLHRKAKFSTRQEVWGCAAGRGALDLLTGSRRGEKNKKKQKKLLKENYVKRKEWCQLPQRCWIICLWKHKHKLSEWETWSVVPQIYSAFPITNMSLCGWAIWLCNINIMINWTQYASLKYCLPHQYTSTPSSSLTETRR